MISIHYLLIFSFTEGLVTSAVFHPSFPSQLHIAQQPKLMVWRILALEAEETLNKSRKKTTNGMLGDNSLAMSPYVAKETGRCRTSNYLRFGHHQNALHYTLLLPFL